MKKIIFTLSALLSILCAVSCSKEQLDKTETTPNCNLNFEFTVADFGSKAAIKSSWEDGDKIVLFFNEKGGNAYLTLTYADSKWSSAVSGDLETAIGSGSNGTFDAIYCADSDGSVTVVAANSKWQIGGEDSYYMSQNNGEYTRSGNTVAFTVDLTLDADYVEIYIPGASAGDLLHVHGSTRSGGTYTTGLLAVSCAEYKYKADKGYYFAPSSRTVNGTFEGYSHNDGATFYAIKKGSDTDITFCLKHEEKDWFYSVSGKSFAKGKAVKLPAITDTEKWAEDGARCVLHNSTTNTHYFVINEYKSDEAAFNKKYGKPGEGDIFDLPTETSSTTIPWHENSAEKSAQSYLKTAFTSGYLYVEVANSFKPKSMESWFQSAVALRTFSGINLDMTSVTTLKNAFNGCKLMTSCDVSTWTGMTALVSLQASFANCAELTALDVTKWGATKLQTLLDTFNGCSTLATLDLSKWGGNLKTNSALQKSFLNCAALTSIDLSGFTINTTGTSDKIVTSCVSCFSGCAALTTIYSTESQDWQSTITTSTETFKGCTKLVGGNGTKFDNTKIDKTYARIDKEGQAGYFTLKQ